MGEELNLIVLLVSALVSLLVREAIDNLPSLAEKLLRHAARRIAKEQREQHLNELLGELDVACRRRGKITVLLWAFRVWLKRHETADAVEGAEPFAGDRWKFAAKYAYRHASWLAGLPAVWLLTNYPFAPSRYPAYAVLVPALMGWILWFSPAARRAAALLYETLNYFGRVSFGGTTMLLGLWIAVNFSLIAPSWRHPARVQLGPGEVAKKQIEVFLITPELLPVERSKATSSATDSRVTADGASLSVGSVVDSTSALGSSAPASISGVKELFIFDQPNVPLPEQPIPVDSSIGGRLAAPTNLRVLGPASQQ